MRNLIIGIWVLLFPTFLCCQVVCITSDGEPCTPKESRAHQKKICEDEKAPPNLFIAETVRFIGTLFDETGAPIVYPNTVVQIKDPKTNTVLFAKPLDVNGGFDFDSISIGAYRFIAIQFENGENVRLPLAEQPQTISCAEAPECRVKVIIHFHGTDNLIDFCPPK